MNRRSFVGYLSVAIALTFGFAPVARAQEGEGGGGGGGNRRGGDRPSMTDQIKAAVGLSDELTTKVKALEEQWSADVKKGREEAGEDRAARREKMTAAIAKFRAAVRELLDKDQQVKFDEWAKKQEEQFQQGRGGQGGQGRRGGGGGEGGADQKPVNGHPDKTIALGKGGFDYLNAHAASRKLYVAHSTTIDVIDMDKDEKIGSVEGVDGAHGTAISLATKHGFATSGKKKALIAFDLDTNKVLKEIPTGDGPDACWYASSVDEAWSINHRGGSVTCVDAKTFEVKATVDVGGTLEFAAEIGDKVFVNIEDKDSVAVIDAKKHEVTGKYSTAPGTGCAGLAADPKTGLLFVGCHNKKLVVMEAATGKVVASLDIGQGNDAVAFDAETNKVYASCGDGTTTVFLVKDAKTVETVKTIETARGGKTCSVDSKTHKLYVAVGARRGQDDAEAKVLVFYPEGASKTATGAEAPKPADAPKADAPKPTEAPKRQPD